MQMYTHKVFSLKKTEGKFGAKALWYNVCLTCLRSQVQSPELQKRGKELEWRDGSEVKNTGCSYRGPGFDSHIVSHSSL